MVALTTVTLPVTATAAAADEAAAPNSNPIQEVVVTAQRRSEAVEKVPMSVSVVTAATLQKSGVQNVHDLSQLVAGASVSFAGCCSQPAIRGISTLTTGVGFENNVAIYVDGLYVPDNLSVNGDLANISSIEVLKGPQGALWGRNATGGAILINTLAPSRSFTGDIEAGYGSYNEAVGKVYLSGPITNRIGFSVAAAARSGDGYYDWIGPTGAKFSDRFTPVRQITVRTKLQAEVTDWFTATLAYNYADSSDSRGTTFQFYQHIPSTLCIFQCFSTAALNRPTGDFQAAADLRPTTETKLNEVSLKAVFKTPIGDLTSITGFDHRGTRLNFDFDESWIPILDSYQKYRQDTFQESVNYNITAIKNLDLTIGGEVFNDIQQELFGIPFTSVGAPPYVTFSYTNQSWAKSSQSFAIYFDGAYHLTDQLVLDLGARYSHDDVRADAVATGIVANPFATAKTSFSAFTPRASLRYEFAPHTNVYFTYSQGYRNGGYNPVPPLQTTPFQPEKIRSYELGFKTVQASWQFNSAIFYYDYSNMQVGIVEQSNGGTTLTDLTGNAKSAKVYGWDNDIVAHPIENLTLRAGAEWLHARYSDFSNASGTGLCIIPGIIPACGPANVGTDVPETQNLSGQRMIRAPEFSGFAGGDYEFHNVFGGVLDAAANVSFQTSAPTENASVYGPAVGDPAQANQQRYVDGPYALVNATLTWKDASRHYTVTLWANNLTNTKYLIVNAGVPGFGDFHTFGEPITGGFRVGYSF
jgi:iron complex outermembrane receptor protein